MTRVRAATMALCLFGALGAVVPALAAAGSLSGTVTAAAGGAPIAGVEVCSRPEPHSFEPPCATTDGTGSYSLPGLPAGSYEVRFREPQNRNYIDQFFDGKTEPGAADLVTIDAAENRTGIDAALQPGGTITGTVTGADGAGPVVKLQVCAFAITTLGGVGRCWRTDGSGNYAINGLPPEEYKIEFLPEGEFNYLPQYYDGVSTWAAATPIPVTAANEVVAAIDAALLPGVEINGTLTEAETHRPLSGIDVALLEPGSEKVLDEVATDVAGRYAFRGRLTGTYAIAFAHLKSGPYENDCYSPQYYKGASSFGAATLLTAATPGVLSGIDGELTNNCLARPQPVQVTFRPSDPLPPPLKCKKNQRKRWVKGKYRCVKRPKKHKKHHHRGRGHGPQAVATDR